MNTQTAQANAMSDPNTSHDLDKKIIELGNKVKSAPPRPEPNDQRRRENHAHNFDMRMTAQMIQSTVEGAEKYGQKNLFKLLRDHGVLWTRGDLWNVAKRNYIESGYFHTAYVTKMRGDTQHYHLTTFVTPNGLSFVADLVQQDIIKNSNTTAPEEPSDAP